MKLILIILSLNCWTDIQAQKIKKVEIDKFTGHKRILTEHIRVEATLTKVMNMYLRTVDTTVFISFYGTVGIGVIGTMDGTTFLFPNKSTLTVYPTGIQSYDGYGSNQYYDQQYLITKDQLEMLAANNPVSVRRIYNSNYVDVDIKSKFSPKISELAAMVLNEMNKSE